MIHQLSTDQTAKLKDWTMNMFSWNYTLEGTAFWNWLYCSFKPGAMFPTQFVVPQHVLNREDDELWATVDLLRLDAFRRYVYTSTTCTAGILYIIKRLDIIAEDARCFKKREEARPGIETPNEVGWVRRSALITPTSPRAARRQLLLI